MLKFSSAVLPESYMQNEMHSSGENYENFYAKTRDIDDIDEKSLIDKLRSAQEEIDNTDYKQSRDMPLDDSDYSEEESDDLFTDFTLRGVLFGKNKAEKLVGGEPERFDCISCESPDCSYPHVSRGCLMCYTAHVRDTEGEEERSRGCANSATNVAMICSTRTYDGRHTHAEHGVSAQYAIDCCRGELCNNGTDWPQLPAVPTHVEKEGGGGALGPHREAGAGRAGAGGGAGAAGVPHPDGDAIPPQEEDGGAQHGGRGVPGRAGGAAGPGRGRLHAPGDIRPLDDERQRQRSALPGAADPGQADRAAGVYRQGPLRRGVARHLARREHRRQDLLLPGRGVLDPRD